LFNNHLASLVARLLCKYFEDYLVASGGKVIMEEDMLTLTAAADFVKISPEVLRRHAKNGIIPAHKEGRTWRFSRKELEAWLHDGGPQIAAAVDNSPWGK
jgi:excisionase family DNA binding protein